MNNVGREVFKNILKTGREYLQTNRTFQVYNSHKDNNFEITEIDIKLIDIEHKIEATLFVIEAI